MKIKNIIIVAVLVSMVGLLLYGAVTWTQAKSNTDYNQAKHGYGNSENGDNAVNHSKDISISQPRGRNSERSSDLITDVTGTLTQAEEDALFYMYEEEKLARDVYTALYEQWELPVFQNIIASEQAHMDSVKTLLVRYGLSEPASQIPGVFTNQDLQALYDQLITKGKLSTTDAILVGGAIEEIDILDLRERISLTDKPDIKQTFTNLMNGSINHLNAFAQNYQKITGLTYTPQYMTMDEYQSLFTENGQGKGSGGGYRGGRKNS